MIKKVPEFRDESEEARFWDSHDATDFLSELEDDRSTVFVRPEAEVVTLGGEAWQNLLGAARPERGARYQVPGTRYQGPPRSCLT